MGLTDRRALLRLAAAGALSPWLGVGAAALARAPVRFDPPPGPLRYTRRLVRPLAGGEAFVAARSFAVRFARRPDGGFILAGEQTGVEVAAPEGMARFAELERQRVETGLFPIELDANGIIEAGPGRTSSRQLDAAVAEARRMFAEHAALPRERAEFDAFVMLVHQVGIRLSAHLPEDLFAPAQARRTERRAIALDGSGGGDRDGSVEIVFTAEADPLTGLMRRARREIVTVYGGERKASEEDWALGPL